MYLTAQCIGGLVAGFFSLSLTDIALCSDNFPQPRNGFSALEAMGSEFLFTFVLVFVVLSVRTANTPNQFYGLAVGWTRFVALGCIGLISGSALNPAVWLGGVVPAMACADSVLVSAVWKHCWVYLIGDIAGAVVAGYLHRTLFLTRRMRQQKLQKMLTEFIGTFVFVCIVQLASFAATLQNNSVIAVETIGFGLVVLVYAFGYISGAHFNPSVSIAVWLQKRADFTTRDLVNYVAVQLFGALFGGLFCYGIGGERVAVHRVDYDHSQYSTAQAFFAEALFTFNLCHCVLHTAHSAVRDNQYYGLAIGSSYGIAVAAVGINGISGACLNGALWFGTTVSALCAGTAWSALEWEHLWIYIIAPLCGAVSAGVLFKHLFADFDLDSEVDYVGEREKHRVRRLVCEALGSFSLLLFIKLVSASPDAAPYGVAFALMSLVYQYGYLSQAHLNPAITLAVWLHGDIEGFPRDDLTTPALYVALQMFGAWAGGMAAWGIGGDAAGSVYPHIHGDRDDAQVFGGEFVFTALLVAMTYTNLTLAQTPMPSGMAIGWLVMASIGAIGSLDAVSGCCLNPAVWFGATMSAAASAKRLSDIEFHYVWVYLSSELLAGALVALLFRWLWKDPQRRATKLSRYIAECVGAFYLVCFAKLSGANAQSTQPMFSYGLGFCALVYCFGCISGAHFNPAVTLGVMCRGSVEGFDSTAPLNAFAYVTAQCLGAIVGGLFCAAVTVREACFAVYPRIDTDEVFDAATAKAFGAEMAFTFLMVSAFIHCGVTQQNNDFYGVAIGFVLFVAQQLIGVVSGCALNPAVWLGSVLSATVCAEGSEEMRSLKWQQFWIYVLGASVGGVLAGWLCRALYFEREKSRAINDTRAQPINDPGILTRRDQ